VGLACAMHWRYGKAPAKLHFENLTRAVHVEDLGINGRVIFKCILKTNDIIRMWTGFILLRIEPGGCEYYNKSSGCVKGRIFVISSTNISSLRQAQLHVLVRRGQVKFCCVRVR